MDELNLLAGEGGEERRAVVWIAPDGRGKLIEGVEGIGGASDQHVK